MFSSIYKDSNTLHLPTERFSPVRRFSDGAASIQAFKAHLEKMGNNSSIKQLQQVKERGGSPQKSLCKGFLLSQPCCFRKQKVKSVSLMAVHTQWWLSSRGAVPPLSHLQQPCWVSSKRMCCSLVGWEPWGLPPPFFWAANYMLCPHMGCYACPCGSHQHCQAAAAAVLHFLQQQSFGAVPGCPG